MKAEALAEAEQEASEILADAAAQAQRTASAATSPLYLP